MLLFVVNFDCNRNFDHFLLNKYIGIRNFRPFNNIAAVVSFTNPPVISGSRPENNGPPPLTLGKEVELCWLLPLTL